jgi:hemoglobin/transferrin/lactoferrin receptor protein
MARPHLIAVVVAAWLTAATASVAHAQVPSSGATSAPGTAADAPRLPETNVVADPSGESTTRNESPLLNDSPFDRPFSFPSLTEQTYTPFLGATRGGRSLFDTPIHGSIIQRNQLQERGATDMVRALQTEVGVLMQQTARGQASPFIRGLTGQQVLLLVDGIRLNNGTYRSGPNQYFNLIDPGSIGQIEVVRGPQSVSWGSDAIGGAINVISREANHSRGEHHGGSFNEIYGTADRSSYSRFNGELVSGKHSLFVGGSYLNVRDLDRGGNLGRQPYTNYDQYAGDLNYNYLLTDNLVMTIGLQHFEQPEVPRSDRFLPFVQGTPPNPAILPRPSYFDPQQRDLAYIRLQGLSDSLWFDGYTHTVSYQRNKEGLREERIAANPANTRIDIGEFNVNTVGYTMTLAKNLDWLGTATYGADIYHDQVNASRNRFNPNTPNAAPVAQAPQFPNDSRYQRVGTFMNWDTPLTDRLTMFSGVRYESVDARGTTRINNVNTLVTRNYDDAIASLGYTYNVIDDVNFTGSVSEGFRAPNLDDLFADATFLQNQQSVSSINVRPEVATNYEIGLKINKPRLRAQVVEFWTNIHDYITRLPVNGNGVFDPNSSNFIRTNSQAYINGTEISGEFLLERGWSTYGNFWYTYGTDRGLNEPVSRIPPVQGILGLRWREERSRAWFEMYTWMVNRVSPSRYAFVNTRDARFPTNGTPGFATLNFRAGRTFGDQDQHRLSMNLENVTDKAYRVLGSGVDGAGINAIFSWEWQR